MKRFKRESTVIWVMGVLVWSGLMAGCGAEKIHVATHYTKTSDGWTLQVDRYEPTTPEPAKDPVVLCHGLGYNNRFWDLTDKTSLARYLARHGYDVWSVSLRGAGLSDQPVASVMRKIATFSIDPKFLVTMNERSPGTAAFSDYSVDDHINYDVPAVIELVKEKSGAKKVHWVGHSMGGMIMMSYLGSEAALAKDVHTFVAVSVPMVMFHPLNRAMQMQVDNAELIKAGNVVVSTAGDSLVAKVLGKWAPPTVLETLFLNRDNVEDGTLRLLAQWGQESISTGQLTQLLDLAAEEEFYSFDKKVNYTSLLGKVTTPTFFLVGQLDNMATVGAVKYAYREVGSGDKQFRMFGRINGDRANYGHDDIIIGRHARAEVFPKILKWLDGHK